MTNPIPFLAALLVTTQVITAHAADMGKPQGYDWSGPYAGVFGGYVWSSTKVTDLGVIVESAAPTNGLIGGLTAGYNVQNDQWVYGLDVDAGLGSVQGHGIAVVPPANPNVYDLNFVGHVRARLGLSPDQGPFMAYLAGGVGIASFKFTNGENGEQTTGTYIAPSLGVGVEYAASNNLSLRFEGLYDAFSIGSGMIVANDYKAWLNDAVTVRVGLDYRF